MKTGRSLKSIISVSLCLVGLSFSMAWGNTLVESKVKSAYIFNFTKFARWPAPAVAGQNLVICIAAPTDVRDIFTQTLSGKNTQGRTIAVELLVTADTLQRCDLAYFHSITDTTRSWLEQARKGPVLTIGEGPEFVAAGGIIGFIPVDGKLRFNIHRRQAEDVGIFISSQLLKLANKVEE